MDDWNTIVSFWEFFFFRGHVSFKQFNSVSIIGNFTSMILGGRATIRKAAPIVHLTQELYYGLADSAVGIHGPSLRTAEGWKVLIGTGGGSGDPPAWWRTRPWWMWRGRVLFFLRKTKK